MLNLALISFILQTMHLLLFFGICNPKTARYGSKLFYLGDLISALSNIVDEDTYSMAIQLLLVYLGFIYYYPIYSIIIFKYQ